jgi:type VI secretion system protein ImpH
MAGANGQTRDSLIAQLRSAPWTFDFYAAIREMQKVFRDSPRIGHSRSLGQDPVRFAQNPSLGFAPSTLEAVQQDAGKAPVVYCRHFGLFGPNGPLPLCLTEYARQRILHFRDSAFIRFCNVFHHRLTSFFFRSWADARKTVDYDRPDTQKWGYYVGSLAGLGMTSLLSREKIPDKAKLYYAGRLAMQARNAEGLEAIIEDFFGIKTQVQTFQGRWIDLPAGSQCRLGESRNAGTLGANVIVGSRVLACQMSFRLRMGPMKLLDFERLLPNGESFARLRDWIRHYDTLQHDWDVQLALEGGEVPQTQLGMAGRLGWTTWLKSEPFPNDSEDLVLSA